MKTNLLKLLFLFFSFVSINEINAQTDGTVAFHYDRAIAAENEVPLYTDEDIRMRLRNIASAIIPLYTNVVKGYIRTYTIKNRGKTEAMLGKAVMYFPIFHKYAKEYGLPEALKYLSVTESALNPIAVSSAKAKGLWQFMPVTGREYGLRIDDTIDERCDPHLSTDAAMRYLQRQYKRFGNWPLAIAAYNSGGGNVSKAIRRGRSKNFWKIRKYLPKETRNYVPAYIGAAYVLQNYEKHNLKPAYPEMDLQLTDAVKVYEKLSFDEIAAVTGLSMVTIAALNPSYKRDYIPESYKGHYLILPKRVMNDFNTHFARPDSGPATRINQAPSGKRNEGRAVYAKSYYTVQQGDNLTFLAKLFNCDPFHLKVWNELKTDYVAPGQELLLFSPSYEATTITAAPAPQIKNSVIYVAALPRLKAKEVHSLNAVSAPKEAGLEKRKEYLYHTIQRNQSLKDISQKYQISIPVLLKINEIENGEFPKPGNRIKVKELQ